MKRKSFGFTLVEMLVAMLAGVVLALTASAMLVFSFTAWGNHTKSVKMQNDASLALLVIGREIRKSNADGIACLGDSIIFYENAVRSNSTRVGVVGDQLVFQPSGFVLVEDWLSLFQVKQTGDLVDVSLSLLNKQSMDSITMEASFAPRN